MELKGNSRLVFTRRIGDRVVIGDGDDVITITIGSIDRGHVRLIIEAPRHIRIDRGEIRKLRELKLKLKQENE